MINCSFSFVKWWFHLGCCFTFSCAFTIVNILKAPTVDSEAVDFAALFPLAVLSRQWSDAKMFAPCTARCKAGCRIPSTARILEALTHRQDEKCKGARQEPGGYGLQSLHLTPGALLSDEVGWSWEAPDLPEAEAQPKLFAICLDGTDVLPG